MNEILIGGIGPDNLDIFARERFSEELAVHRESCSEKGDARSDQVKGNVRRIGGDETKIGASPRQFLDLGQKIIGQTRQVIRGHWSANFIEIDAVDEKFRVSVVGNTLAIKPDDRRIVIESALRPEAAKDAQSFHSGSSIKNVATNQSAFGSSSLSSTERTPSRWR